VAVLRKLVWIEEDRFQGWGCSECAWWFTPPDSLTGKSLNGMVRNFELQRDKEFASHICADHPGTKGAKRSIKFKLDQAAD